MYFILLFLKKVGGVCQDRQLHEGSDGEVREVARRAARARPVLGRGGDQRGGRRAADLVRGAAGDEARRGGAADSPLPHHPRPARPQVSPHWSLEVT